MRGDRGREQTPARSDSVVPSRKKQDADTLGVLLHLSHEIRTPLNSMLALSQLLRDGLAGRLNPEQQRYIEVIERNGQNLIRLVNDVLDLSRMDAGHVDIEIRSLYLGDQLRATAADMSPLARAKRIQLTVEAVDDLPPVLCDPDRVRQVLTNLIGNAIKFTERGRVTLSAEPGEGVVAVHVTDTGVGIPESARSRLFEEFFRVPASGQSVRREGTGLGLAIASRLVHFMGGDLSVSSTEGVGSRFTFTLPVAHRPMQTIEHEVEEEEELRDDDGRGAAVDQGASPGQGYEMQGAGAGQARGRGGQPPHRFQDEPHGTNPPGR